MTQRFAKSKVNQVKSWKDVQRLIQSKKIFAIFQLPPNSLTLGKCNIDGQTALSVRHA